MGVRLTAGSREELFFDAVRGLYAVVGELEPQPFAEESLIALAGESLAEALRTFLAEALYLLERERRIVTRVNTLSDHGARWEARVMLAAVDRRRSEFLREVKAVTYYGLEAHEQNGAFRGTFLVDI